MHGGGVVEVLDEAGGGVGFGEGGEGVEEVGAGEGVGEDIAGYAHAEGCEGEEAGEGVGMHFGVAREDCDCGNVGAGV